MDMNKKQELRTIFREQAQLVKALDSDNPDAQQELQKLHSSFVDMCNWYELGIMQAQVQPCWSSQRWLTDWAENCADLLEQVIVPYYSRLHNYGVKFGIDVSSYRPAPATFATIQRMVAKFRPALVEGIRQKFLDSELPCHGFESFDLLPGVNAISPFQLLTQMEIEEYPGVFVLGCFERRVTVYSQQVRALNLVYALSKEGRIPDGTKVLVIGGGVAGITAAAAAAMHGCKVQLVERGPRLLHQFRGNTTRWLHPRIYDWPQAGSEELDAGLPLMNWTASVAGNVVEQLDNAWEQLPKKDNVEITCGQQRINFGQNLNITWNAPGGFKNPNPAIVILATGFGVEAELGNGVPHRGYWKNDDIDQTGMKLGATRRFLITGAGDGGLVDLLRVRLTDFRYDRIFSDVLKDLPEELGLTLLAIEAEAKRLSRSSQFLSDRYNGLSVPPALDDKLRAMLRPDTTAVLNSRDPYPFSLSTSISNRFLVSRLLFSGMGVEYHSGDADVVKTNDGFEVKLGNGRPEQFDEVVCRHGPSARPLETDFRDIHQICSTACRIYARLDQTRAPIYGDHYSQLLANP